MNRNIKIAGGLIAAFIIIFAAAAIYIYVSGGAAQPSAQLNAPQLSTSNSAQKLFRIDPNQSEVSFTLTEKLMGQPKTVVGKTNQVTGDIVVDLDNAANTKIGTLRIDVRSIATDSEMRNRMIRGQILQSSKDEFEFAQFVPTSISGLPAKVAVGDTITFKIVGNLTVRNITKSVTFDATAKLVSASPNYIEGTAAAQVLRSDYKLEIPNVPSVSDVSQEVQLAIKFHANLTS